MGMFDTIRFYGDVPLVCADGHLVAELQTKDLDCSMAEFAVHGGFLYLAEGEGTPAAEPGENGRLSLVNRRSAEPTALTAEVMAYGSCDECRPVLYIRDAALHWDYVDERQPWCEWNLVFVGGRLERVQPIAIETREEVGQKLRKEGLEVLDDDDRLARRHFARREREAEPHSFKG